MSESIPENNIRSWIVAVFSAVTLFVSIFVLEVSISKQSLNILISGNKALALGGLILIGIFLIIETISRYRPKMIATITAGRIMGGIGFVFALIHVALVMFVLTETFSGDWLQKQLLSIDSAKAAVVVLLLLFVGSIKAVSDKLGEKKWLYRQVLGYIGLILVLVHTMSLVKPSYYSVGTLLGTMRQLELTFILIFLASIVCAQILLYFVNKRLSLQIKIVVHTFIYFAMSAIIIGTYIGISDTQKHHKETFHNNLHMATYIQNAVANSKGGDAQGIYGLADSLSNTSNGETTIFFIDSNKEITHTPIKKEEGTIYANLDLKKPANDSGSWDIQNQKGGNLFLDTAVNLGSPYGYLIVSTNFTKSDIGFTREIIYSILLIALVIFITGIMTLFFARKNILGPVKKISDAAKKMSEGDFGASIQIKSNDEFATLADIFNTMAQRLKKQIDDLMKVDKLKNEFIAIASHNLRTPLTTLRGYLDMLGSETPGKLNMKQKDTLQKAQHSATALASLTEGLVNITSLETEGVKIEKNSVNLTKVIEGEIEEISSLAKGKDITIENNIGKKDIMTIGDEAKLKQAFLAVLENAIKFNNKGGKVILDKIVDDSKQKIIGRPEVIFTIKDTGIGIAKNEKENVFQKFNRGTSTYTYEYEGVGLGLYLTKLIIQAHRGHIWFESKEGKGTTFYISLTTT